MKGSFEIFRVAFCGDLSSFCDFELMGDKLYGDVDSFTTFRRLKRNGKTIKRGSG